MHNTGVSPVKLAANVIRLAAKVNVDDTETAMKIAEKRLDERCKPKPKTALSVA